MSENLVFYTEDIDRCPACASVDYKFLFNAHDVQFSKTMMSFPVVKCSKCGVFYLAKRPKRRDISNFYSEETYYFYNPKNNSIISRVMKKAVKDRLKRRKKTLFDAILWKFLPDYWCLAASMPPGSKILDIGCGAGYKLNLYKEFGWATFGFDISPEAIRIAKSKGHDVILGEINNLSYSDDYFDAIQISHVIEHLPNPVSALTKTFQLLRKDGLVLLETPNSASILAKFFKQDFWQIDAPRHFQLFDTKNLTNLVRSAGLRIINIRTKNSRNGFLNSLQARVVRKNRFKMNLKQSFVLRLISRFVCMILNLFNIARLGENIVLIAKK